MSHHWKRLVSLALFCLSDMALSESCRLRFGTYELEPGLVPSRILAALPQEARLMERLDLGLHRSIPFGVKRVPRGRSGEYAITCLAEAKSSHLLLPGSIGRKLEYQGGRKGPVRFEIHAYDGGLTLHS